MTFNGVKLTDNIIVMSGFTLLDGAEFDPVFFDYKHMNGSKFAFTRRKPKNLPVPFFVRYESIDDYDNLERALNVSEPKKLIFSSHPNRFMWAIPSGSLDFKEIKLSGKGVITFIIPDGLMHSTVGKTFDFIKNNEGIFETTIVNNGTEDAHVDYTVNISKESGFLGIVGPNTAMQFGKREEVDGVIEVKNVTIASNQGGNFANWTNGTTFYESQTKKAVTTMGFDTQIGGRLGVLPSSFTNSANGAQFGAIKEIALLQNSKNWYLWSRAMFETSRIDQTGAMCLAIVDTDNNLIAAMAIEKTSKVQNRAVVHFIMGDGSGGARAVKSIHFTPNSKMNENPYGEESRSQKRNMFDIRKIGDTVTFFWYGSYFSFVESGIANKEAKTIQYFVGQYAGQPSNKLVARTYINDLLFQKVGVENWVDIPNRYPNGSKLQVVGSDGSFYVNAKNQSDDEIIGSNYFKVPPGETKVQLIVSSFSEISSAKAEIIERWI